MRKVLLALVLTSIGFAPAMAGFGSGYPTFDYSSNSETAAFVGIQVDLGDMQTELVGGVRNTKTDKNNEVTGAKVDVAMPMFGDKPFVPILRIIGLMGSTELQGEAGVGYDFATQQPLLGLGAQGPYVNGGVNLKLEGGVRPYIGVNTLQDAPERASNCGKCAT